MIRVNLLPHREEKRKARRTQFYALSGMVVVLAALIWFFGFLTIGRWIAAQDEKNAFLKKEVAVLDKDIAEIKRLREQTEIMLSRNRVIESLQATRAETVHLFTELARWVPEGIYLKSVKQTGRRITLIGYAQANARVSELMQKLDASPLLERPELIEIRSATLDRRRLSEFQVTFDITQQTASADKKGEGKPAAGAPKPGAKP
ncbi:PilN domain-containing protein [Sulfurisoma sediminicola]|uniref:Type IV pilus assembly protein PilN n=1 Tax=Sulfurisoma sediminicola TaxID=1381557 RepID=A0A497XKV4_9PROT|nr:PilN domain-containing protein [Sulfurisoma sediminicola]RLJ67935.1 type IV pilus assembly protein PilN [Sulfurisoma sediminicola]